MRLHTSIISCLRWFYPLFPWPGPTDRPLDLFALNKGGGGATEVGRSWFVGLFGALKQRPQGEFCARARGRLFERGNAGGGMACVRIRKPLVKSG